MGPVATEPEACLPEGQLTVPRQLLRSVALIPMRHCVLAGRDKAHRGLRDMLEFGLSPLLQVIA